MALVFVPSLHAYAARIRCGMKFLAGFFHRLLWRYAGIGRYDG